MLKRWQLWPATWRGASRGWRKRDIVAINWIEDQSLDAQRREKQMAGQQEPNIIRKKGF